MALTQDETVELRLQTYQRLLEASLVAAMPIAEMPMTETPMTEMPMTETPIARVESVYVCAMALQAAVEGIGTEAESELPVLEPVLTLLLRRLGEVAAEAEKSGGFAAAAVSFCVTQMLRGWLVPLLEPKLPALMEVLLVFLRREPENAALLKAVATATKFFARRWPEAFYDMLRSIAQVAAGSSMNGEEFVRELMGLFGSFATVCCAEFNADEETVRGVIAVCVRLAVQAGNRGKVAVFAFLNKLLRLENDNEGIRAVFAQMAPQLLDVNLTDSRHP